MSPQPFEHLAGTIERVTFHGADSGFSVLRVNAKGQRSPVITEIYAELDREKAINAIQKSG